MDDRRQIFIRGFLGSVSAHATTAIVSLVSIPIGLGYFGTELFGAWLIIESTMVIMNLSQYGMRTATAAMVAGEIDPARRQAIVIKSFLIMMAITTGLLIITVLFAYQNTLWMRLFGDLSPELSNEVYWASFLAVVLYISRIPAITFVSSFTGYQEVHYERLYGAMLPGISNLLSIIFVKYINGSLVLLAVIAGITQLVIGIVAGVHLYLRHFKRHIPTSNSVTAHNNGITKSLLISGRKFFLVGIAAVFVSGTDNIVISTMSGAENVTGYAVTFRAFIAVYALLSLANFALWPMLARAVSISDWGWVKEIYRRLIIFLPIIGGFIWIAAVGLAQPAIELWSGPDGYGGKLVVFAMGAYAYVLSLISTMAGFLSAINRPQVKIALSEAALNLVMSVLLFRIWGTGGVACATVLSAVFTTLWASAKSIAMVTDYAVITPWRLVVRHLSFAVLPALLFMMIATKVLIGWAMNLSAVIILGIYLVGTWILTSPTDKALLRQLVSFRGGVEKHD